jgi:phosphoribosylaminoimidazole-succinocarboxamide synthase
VHTPDSSRFFYLDSYDDLQQQGKPQRQLSKEFVREWLMENNFQGLKGELVPDMPDEFVQSITDRYTELYTAMTGKQLNYRNYVNIIEDMEEAINHELLNFE